MRAVCYPRVSSQAQRERQSIDSQLRELPELATRHGWELVRPVDYYIDDGRSAKAGKLEKRTGLRRLLHDAAAGEFDIVIMAAVDRLTRSERWAERGMIIGALQDAGVRVCSSDSGELIDLDSDEGDLIISLKSYVAAAENRRKAKAIRGGKLSSALRGGRSTGPDPYGLHYDKASNTWSIDPVRGPVVREILERIAAGKSCLSVAVELTRRGVPFPMKAKGWSKANVRYIARSTHSIGEYVAHRKSRTIVAVPRIADHDLWQRAQDALTENRLNGLERTKFVYLLQGLAVCGLCGARMRMRSPTMEKGRWFRPAAYVCTRRLPYEPAPLRTDHRKCTGLITVENADSAAWAEICRAVMDPALPAELAEERRGIASDGATYEQDAAGYQAHIDRLDAVQQTVLERFRRGLFSEAVLDKELAALRRERAAVSAQLRHAEKARGKTANAQARIGAASDAIARLRVKMAKATPEERREIALTMIDPGGVAIFPDEIRIDLLVERPASARRPSGAIVDGSFSTAAHESRHVIRLVARVAA